MASFISIAIPYMVVGGVFNILQILYLLYFRGRVNGVSLLLSKCGNKFLVDLFSILIIGLIMGTPFLIYVISGIHLAADDCFEGIYVLLLISVHLVVLSFLFWYMRRWRMSVLVRTFF